MLVRKQVGSVRRWVRSIPVVPGEAIVLPREMPASDDPRWGPAEPIWLTQEERKAPSRPPGQKILPSVRNRGGRLTAR